MTLQTFNARYNLVEFNHTVNEVDGNCVCMLELLIEGSLDEFDEENFGGPILIESDRQSYVFSDFEVSEYYGESGLIRVVLVK